MDGAEILSRTHRPLPGREGIDANGWPVWPGPSLMPPRPWRCDRRGVALGQARLGYGDEMPWVASDEAGGSALQGLGAPMPRYPLRNAVQLTIAHPTDPIRPRKEAP